MQTISNFSYRISQTRLLKHYFYDSHSLLFMLNPMLITYKYNTVMAFPRGCAHTDFVNHSLKYTVSLIKILLILVNTAITLFFFCYWI